MAGESRGLAVPDFETFTTYLRAIFVALYPPVASEEWKGWKPDQVKSLNTLLHLLDEIFNKKIRPQYDQTFYNLAKTTKVVAGLEPVRKETVRGKSDDAKAPSAEDIFAALVGETPTETKESE